MIGADSAHRIIQLHDAAVHCRPSERSYRGRDVVIVTGNSSLVIGRLVLRKADRRHRCWHRRNSDAINMLMHTENHGPVGMNPRPASVSVMVCATANDATIGARSRMRRYGSARTMRNRR